MELRTIERRYSEKTVTVTLSGRIDAVTAPELKAYLKRLVKDGLTQLIVDLTDVSFVDSSGLAAFVSGFRAAREAGGTLKLAGLDEQTRTVFTLTRLDRVFDIYPDAGSALETFSTL